MGKCLQMLNIHCSMRRQSQDAPCPKAKTGNHLPNEVWNSQTACKRIVGQMEINVRNSNRSVWLTALLAANAILLVGWASNLRAEDPPLVGTFYSLQLSNAPPFPYDPWPDLPHWALGNGIFVVDDSTIDYLSFEQSSASPPVPGAGAGADTNAPIPAYNYPGTCAFWLEIAATNTLMYT